MNEYNYASQGADYRVDYDPDLIAERPLQRRQRNERINDNSRDRGSDETDNGAKTSARRETTAPPKERNSGQYHFAPFDLHLRSTVMITIVTGATP